MKVTKRRNGYTIRLSNNEYEMLDKIITMSPPDAVRRSLSGDVKGAYSRRVKATNGDLLRPDVDASERPLYGSALARKQSLSA